MHVRPHGTHCKILDKKVISILANNNNNNKTTSINIEMV